MASGVRINSAVMFVQELDRSLRFYLDLLGLTLVSRDPTAALLASPAGAHLILRSMGKNAPHPLGSVGVQYVVWTAGGEDELAHYERVLRDHSAYLETRSSGGVTVVEGRDPDGVVVMITYPGLDEVPPRELPARIYGW